MCGIAGVWEPRRDKSRRELESLIGAMADTMSHRGPDDSGVWADAGDGIALGHRRLSIIDLSPMGRQPMLSACGRYVISYNGEVYNFGALRAELEPLGHSFRGHSDTEVILAAFAEWGVEAAVRKFIGMFAIGLYDREGKKIFLVRDRLGIKPVYYGWFDGVFAFASEMKAICAHPGFRRELNRDVLPLYFHYKCIPAPYSIYKGMNALEPGSLLTLDEGGAARREPEIKRYWSALKVVESGLADPFAGTEEEAADELDALLRDSVRLRMISDVPIGAFLSGGVDSSTVAALMQAQNTSKVNTYSIGFHEGGYNEAVYAAGVAKHLGTEHTEMYVSPKEALEIVPNLPWLYDEPFGDASQIPTHVVSWLTRRHVTVALSGDGGDELFCGYPRFAAAERVWTALNRAPKFLRAPAARALGIFSESAWNKLLAPLLPVARLLGKKALSPGKTIRRIGLLAGSVDLAELYNLWMLLWPDLGELLTSAPRLPTVLTDPARRAPARAKPLEQMMYYDLAQYLPDDILTKVDRASMAVSLETRVPIIDHRVVEFAWRLPLDFKARGGETKRLLRKVLYRYVPRELIERPKMGFGVPVGEWIRGPLRDWAEDLLEPGGLRADGIFHPETVLGTWKEHLDGLVDHQYRFWPVLMFQAWRKRWLA